MTRTELLQKLKYKRKELAEREGAELFMVFTNKTLEETVKAMPQTLEDLALVKGWGKTKIAKYGLEVLSIINNANNLEAELPSEGSGSTLSRLEEAVFSVSEFIEAVTVTLARLGIVRVRGEVSELRHRGAAVYFILKDVSGGDATIKCVLWAWKFEREYHFLEDGMEIIVEAAAEVYAKYGSLDLRVERIEPVGEGALRKAFEALQKKLTLKGYFDTSRKRPFPRIIRRVGVITSEKGEAINDFLKNIGAFGFTIILADVRVEGDQAEESIVQAFRYMNTKYGSDLDVLCLIRGGGGLENLKAFNAERVADAIVSSRIPVLTGIGHERDSTIAGLCSDADFSTPTKAADAIRRHREELLRELDAYTDKSLQLMRDSIREFIQACSLMEGEIVRAFDRMLERYRLRMSTGTRALEAARGALFEAFHVYEQAFVVHMHTFYRALEHKKHLISMVSQRMHTVYANRLAWCDRSISLAQATLLPLNPEAPLQRGYSIAYGRNGRVVKSAQDVTIGEHITVRVYRGSISADVTSFVKNRAFDKTANAYERQQRNN